MENVKKVTMVVTILVVGFVCSSSYGQEEIDGGNGWKISVTPYFFAPDIDAKSTVNGGTAKLDLSFSDILDDFDVFGLSGRVEMWKGDWGLFFDGAYLSLESDFRIVTPAPVIDVDVEVEDATLDFGMAYKLVKVPLEDSGARMLTVEPLGGVRYHYLKQDIKLKTNHPVLGPIGATLGGDEDWVEPFIGSRVTYDLTEKLAAGVRADIGGFGIGSASKLIWNFLAGIDWNFRKNMSLKAGYRILDVDYSRHSGAEEFGFDGQMKGPMIGLTILF
ncbi:MAG: outer membrane protein [Planctomycetota bacterium]|jgi:opacity protein-like surface antigen